MKPNEKGRALPRFTPRPVLRPRARSRSARSWVLPCECIRPTWPWRSSETTGRTGENMGELARRRFGVLFGEGSKEEETRSFFWGGLDEGVRV